MQRFLYISLMLVAASAGAATLIVDDDKVQCPNAAFISISVAAAAANPGDIIRVCPGLYLEDVQITKQLTFLGASNGKNQKKRCGEIPDQTHDSIVTSIGNGFDVQADNVVIDGFVFQSSSNGVILRSDGNEVANNRFRSNHSALSGVNSGLIQTVTVIEENCFQGDDFGTSGFFKNTRIEDNSFDHDGGIFANTVFPIPIENANLSILRNEFDHAGLTGAASIDITGATDLVISGNDISHPQFRGISVSEGLRVIIRDNKLQDGPGDGIAVSSGQRQESEDILVEKNEVTGFPLSGILVQGLSDSSIADNSIRDNGQSGIEFFACNSILVSRNRAKRNGVDGIRVDAFSSGNTIEQNHLSENVEHDAHDDSVGSGTAGTNNLWIKNKCKTENRPGLCH